ncbi:hypothetical protein WHZ78_01145 [Bradyrhizobium symbiodeficiens]|uniref:hypothetical protein n=1 Tax=Bradyrhizobium symbiodeficiens TaxID=1404367 RepID=UPI0030CD079C
MVTEEEAKTIARSVGKPTLEFAASIVAPLYWAQRDDEGIITARNGTAFFLRKPDALFGVTAAHVVEGPGGWRESCAHHGKAPLRLGAKNGASVELPWDARCIDIDIDIATFAISPREIETIERVPYGGLRAQWPPPALGVDVGITYSGFPAIGTRNLSREAVQFGVLCGTGLVSSVIDRDISMPLERDYLEPVLGEGVAPEDYDFSGISGGPLIYNVLTARGLLVKRARRRHRFRSQPFARTRGVHSGIRAFSGAASGLHPCRRLPRPRTVGLAAQSLTFSGRRPRKRLKVRAAGSSALLSTAGMRLWDARTAFSRVGTRPGRGKSVPRHETTELTPRKSIQSPRLTSAEE